MSNAGLPWKDLFDSAILYSQKGFPVTASLARWEEINVDPKDPNSGICSVSPDSNRLT